MKLPSDPLALPLPHLWSSIIGTGLLTVAAAVAFGMVSRSGSPAGRRRTRRLLAAAAVMTGATGSLLTGYGVWVAAGPKDPVAFTLVAGARYERLALGDAVAHLVTIDLAHPCVTLASSVVDPDGRAAAMKTVTWAQQNSMVAAINGSFFFPYDQSRFWAVYPREGQEVTVLGPLVRRSGETGSPAYSGSGVPWDGQTVSVGADDRPEIGFGVADGSVWAVTGRHRLLAAGVVTAPISPPYPRTIIAIDRENQTMWWLVVDGKQPGYSRGATLADAAIMLRDRGAGDAIELDGGGSSVLVASPGADIEAVPQRLSRPMQIRIPGRSRAVANHIGLARPTDPACL